MSEKSTNECKRFHTCRAMHKSTSGHCQMNARILVNIF
uniref:Uncharacterized protein n=1 Tax=Anguilla anguilla TaxID=7936 RepID=A0A0E9QWA9_ANGAN